MNTDNPTPDKNSSWTYPLLTTNGKFELSKSLRVSYAQDQDICDSIPINKPLKANDNCRIDSIYLDLFTNIDAAEEDSIFIEVDYCGQSCGCNDIAYMEVLNERGNSLAKEGTSISALHNDQKIGYDFWFYEESMGVYELIIKDSQGKEMNTNHKIVILPGSKFSIENKGFKGCPEETVHLSLSQDR